MKKLLSINILCLLSQFMMASDSDSDTDPDAIVVEIFNVCQGPDCNYCEVDGKKYN